MGQVPLRNIIVFMVVSKIYIRYEISIVFISICIYNISMSMFIEVYIFTFMFVCIYIYILEMCKYLISHYMLFLYVSLVSF